MSARRLIALDDDELIRHVVKHVAEQAGFDACVCGDSQQFQDRYPDFDPELVLLDLGLGPDSGIDILEFLAEKRSRAAVMLISGLDCRVMGSSVRLGERLGLTMLAPMAKPFQASALAQTLKALPMRSSAFAEADLAKAIEESQFAICYQPKIEIASGRTIGAEALVRWHHPQWGVITPDQFVPFAEQTLQITGLTQFVLRHALDDCRRWRALGHDVGVAVNVSPLSLAHRGVADSLVGLVRDFGLRPSDLTLEVTETTRLRDSPTVMSILTRLRIAGFRLALDDFGTGYSSLVELHRMPFSELKVDKSFVTDMQHDIDAATITKATVGMAHLLGLQVVAEGIEDERTLHLLASCGCDVGQGFHIARPMPQEALTVWLDRREETAGSSLQATVV